MRGVAAALPFVIVATITFGMTHLVPDPPDAWRVGWWTVVMLTGALLAIVMEPLARRLRVIATLFELDAELPLRAPLRFVIGLRAGNTAELQRRIIRTAAEPETDQLTTARLAIGAALAAARHEHLRRRHTARPVATVIACVCIASFILATSPRGTPSNSQVAAPVTQHVAPVAPTISHDAAPGGAPDDGSSSVQDASGAALPAPPVATTPPVPSIPPTAPVAPVEPVPAESPSGIRPAAMTSTATETATSADVTLARPPPPPPAPAVSALPVAVSAQQPQTDSISASAVGLEHQIDRHRSPGTQGGAAADARVRPPGPEPVSPTERDDEPERSNSD